MFLGEGELGESGDSGADGEDVLVGVGVQGDEAGVLRPRADDAHPPAQDVPELRELVEAGARQDSCRRG